MSSLQSLSLFLKHYYACEVCAYTRTHMLHHTSMHIIWKLEDSVIEFVLSTFAWIPEIYLRLPGLCVAFPNWATSQVLWIVWYHYAPMGKAHLSSPFTPLFFSFFFSEWLQNSPDYSFFTLLPLKRYTYHMVLYLYHRWSHKLYGLKDYFCTDSLLHWCHPPFLCFCFDSFTLKFWDMVSL